MINGLENGQHTSVSGAIGWIALGAAVGAGVALLFAPCSGRETRELLARKAKRVGDTTKDLVEQGKQKIAGAKDRLESTYSSGVGAHRTT